MQHAGGGHIAEVLVSHPVHA